MIRTAWLAGRRLPTFTKNGAARYRGPFCGSTHGVEIISQFRSKAKSRRTETSTRHAISPARIRPAEGAQEPAATPAPAAPRHRGRNRAAPKVQGSALQRFREAQG